MQEGNEGVNNKEELNNATPVRTMEIILMDTENKIDQEAGFAMVTKVSASKGSSKEVKRRKSVAQKGQRE